MAELINDINTFTPDALIGGTEIPLLTKGVILVQGSGTVVRGTVLGKITIGAATVAAKSGGNAANTGTCVLDATTPVLAGAKVGVYSLRCVTAASNGGVFRLTDPDGFVIGDYAISGGAGGTVTIANDIKCVITDGAQDFVVDEGFDITIAAGSGYYKIVNSANTDGSAVPDCVLTQNVVLSSSAETLAEAYTQGRFNGDHMVFGGSDTAATHVEFLRRKNIVLTNEQ